MKNIVAYAWFTARTTVGIVIYQNDMKVFKAVIGKADGLDEDLDIKDVADYGAKFSLAAAVLAIGEFGVITDRDAMKELKDSFKPKEE
jgi:hypothetical protein